MSNGNPDDQPILRDLETLLQKSIGKEVIVVDYKTKNLLPAGENYGSTVLKVDAVIKRNKNSPEEELPLVSKMIAISEIQKEPFNGAASFNKEFFVFEKLVPMYKQLEKEAGIKDDKLIDIVPKFYGGRLTMDKNKPDKADKDAAMLMENLKVRGYYTMNRMKGLDFEHAKYGIENLARFHALGIAVKRKNPEFYSEAKKVLNVIAFDLDAKLFDDVSEHTFEMVMKDSRAAKYRDRVRACIESDRGWKLSFGSIDDIEPWSTIMHGDFWVNNMMFHQDSNGKLDDVKFIDFQLTRTTSPLKDLPYYMCTSTSGLVMDNHFDELLDIYHSKFVEVLGIIGIDNSPYSKKVFEDQLKKDAYGEFFHCLMAVKFFMMEVTEDTDMKDIRNSIMMSGAGELYKERCWKIVSKFVEKNWI